MTLCIAQCPSEYLDYEIDWSQRGLGTDTIASSNWSQSSGAFALSSESSTNTTTTFWLTGGNAGTFYTITNTIVTAGGRTMQETVTYECLFSRNI